jgi:glutamine synthetase
MLDGIERRLEPGPPVPGDVGSMAAEAEQHGVRRVPRTLDEALRALEADDVIRTALGPLITDEYVKVKRSEWEDFTGHVGAWDRDWYLGRY